MGKVGQEIVVLIGQGQRLPQHRRGDVKDSFGYIDLKTKEKSRLELWNYAVSCQGKTWWHMVKSQNTPPPMPTKMKPEEK